MYRFLLAAAACSGSGGPSTDTDSDIETDTGALAPVPDEASCELSDNPFVIACTASLGADGPATLILSAEGLPTRTFESPEAAREHTLFGWGLRAETAYTWELAGQTGTVTTGSLPAALSDLDVQTSGTLFGIDAVLVYVSCGWFVMVDGDGQVVWAIPASLYNSLSDGMMWSQADRSLITIRDSTMSNDTSELLERHVSGAELLRLEPGTHFQLGLTHDVGRWGPYTYLLGEGAGRVGGFEVWEGTTHHGTWMLSDGFPAVGNLGISHINGLTVSDDGEVILSVYGFDTIVAVDGDPSSPTFLQLQWHAAGEPDGDTDDLPAPDYVPPSGDLFLKQHNASRHGDELWVFDNRSEAVSRALVMTMDHQAGQISEAASWSVGQLCLNQGGAIPIDGGALVTCANTSDVYAFRDGSSTADWTLTTTCDGGGPPGPFSGSTRAFPVIVE